MCSGPLPPSTGPLSSARAWCAAGESLRGESFAGQDPQGADFTGSDLSEAVLANANLRGAHLNGAKLVHADLRGAIFAKADLRGADLSFARLDEADLRGARLEGAVWRYARFLRAQADSGMLDEALSVGACLSPADEVARWRAMCRTSACRLLAAEARGSLGGMKARLARITVDPQVCGGQPCVRGLRIPVSLILKHLAAGRTPAEVVEEFPELELEDVHETLRYAAWLASGRTIEVPSAA